MCRGVMPSKQEEADIGGQAVGVHGGPILVINQAPQAGPQGGVGLWLDPPGPNPSCQFIFILQVDRTCLRSQRGGWAEGEGGGG